MTTDKKLRIALLGTRGIPARYGGFETFAEQLSTRLAQRGHAVTVFGRRRFFELETIDEYKGVTLRSAPTLFYKYCETPLAGLTSFLAVSPASFDVALVCNAANSPFAWVMNLRGIPYLVNVDGIERNRAKWNSLGRLWYRLGEFSTVKLARRIVADAQVIADYYKEAWNSPSIIIPYGATAVRRAPGVTMRTYGLSRKDYILYVSRLEPENNALGVVRAYKESKVSMPLVIVGDAPYAADYISQVKAEAQGIKVIFTGYQFGEAYEELQSNCALYVQATEVGGTHPALVEAMAYGNCIIANGTPENREVLGNAGAFYEKNDFSGLARELSSLIADEQRADTLRAGAQARASALFDWERITDSYEEALGALTNQS